MRTRASYAQASGAPIGASKVLRPEGWEPTNGAMLPFSEPIDFARRAITLMSLRFTSGGCDG
jgi:hypothetical protein